MSVESEQEDFTATTGTVTQTQTPGLIPLGEIAMHQLRYGGGGGDESGPLGEGIRRIYVTSNTHTLGCEVFKGQITVPVERLPHAPIYQFQLEKPVAYNGYTEKLPRLSPFIVLGRLPNHDIRGPYAVSTRDAPETAVVYASRDGHDLCDDTQKTFQMLHKNEDTAVSGSFRHHVQGRWGVAAYRLPEGSTLVLRFAGFPPPDGPYVLSFNTWHVTTH